jgi:RHH-type proline utilization regulon transcriptional repressor/proline dehydrogenase/delta 1-pyrroline-5-carboxylate dehydrogenase
MADQSPRGQFIEPGEPFAAGAPAPPPLRLPTNEAASAALASARAAIARDHLAEDAAVLAPLIARARFSPAQSEAVSAEAAALIAAVRADKAGPGRLEQLLSEYHLSSAEGMLLMSLAEALLRVPDGATADRLIADKLGAGDWAAHRGKGSLLGNASSLGLLLTGRLVALDRDMRRDPAASLGRLLARMGEPVLRSAVMAGMRLIARDFVLGRTIEEALSRSTAELRAGTRFSYDMLGEGARSAEDAERYFATYAGAIEAIGKMRGPSDSPYAAGISIKLSALHPRFEWRRGAELPRTLGARLLALAQKAAAAQLLFTVDAEEGDRLETTLDLFAGLARAPQLAGWNGLGIAVQAYQKRAPGVINWLTALADETARQIPVRLIKGAYWDGEIKRAQAAGLTDYPVFTRKEATDTAYLACARVMIEAGDRIAPQFGTHNAHTLAAVLALAGSRTDIEFQRLQGMGKTLFEAAQARFAGRFSPRVYAPVGSHQDLLAYLVRRMLENGANNAFVHNLADPEFDVRALTRDPVALITACEPKFHPSIVRPPNLFGPERRNARGIALDNPWQRAVLLAAIEEARGHLHAAYPLGGGATPQSPRAVTSPADHARVIGHVSEATPADIEATLARAAGAAIDWDARGGAARASLLDAASDRFEACTPELLALLMGEGGKTLGNALGELREAVDALRYYAGQARTHFAVPLALPAIAGERNHLGLRGRGIFACISPWNFPLAIFTGQIAAALAAGNAVIAKPAAETPLIAFRAVELMREAGVPEALLGLLPGGPETGAALIADPRIAGVAFTGSTQSARTINRALAAREGPIVPLIAETGGLNAMIADSTALPEQLVDDVVTGAFDSAGQRCSATRVLFVQEEIAPRVIALLQGAIAQLRLGDPFEAASDIGPVINRAALEPLEAHAARMTQAGALIARAPLDPALAARGSYFAPCAFAIDQLSLLDGEVFGPILHVIRYGRNRLATVLEAINATGYGLTLGLHTRLDSTVQTVERLARVGNLYVNRNQIGAVIGMQPFGGEGLSGTGPKAGGPHYLQRFAVERTLTVNTAAAGGDARLMSLE